MAGISIANGVVATDPTVSGSFTNPTISGGTIDGTAIGGTTPAAGKFTTLTATSGVPTLRAQVNVASSITGTLSETTLATITIPAGAVAINSVIRITSLWSMTNNANAKTLTWRLAGTSIGASSVPSFASNKHHIEIRIRGALNSQIIQGGNAGGGWGASTSANLATAIDMSLSQNITLNATLGNTGDTITLEGYTVEILNP